MCAAVGMRDWVCTGQVCQVRPSWEFHERCAAVLTGSLMVLSVYMPHGGYNEEDYITELELVKVIMGAGD